MSHAVVVLPAGARGLDAGGPERRWLGRARLTRDGPGSELLQRILAALNIAPPAEGLGALRLWGQTGEAPSGWIAAADPVYLEARLDHVCLFALGASELPLADLREIFAILQETLGSNERDGRPAFARIDGYGYLRSDRSMTTASVSPRTVDGASPDLYLPEGVAMQTHDRLQSEVQMCLHESEVNHRRGQAGLRPVNSLWFWGGGRASPPVSRDLPALYADDPLIRGYWHSSNRSAAPWPGGFEACLDASPHGFVAVVGTPVGAGPHLASLHRLLSNGRLQALTLLFEDGLNAHFRRSDRFRFWRRGTDPMPDTERP